MKAAVLEGLGRIVVREVEDPQIDADSALLKVESVAVCGSDLRTFHHGDFRVKPPTIIGHESAGTIVEVGQNVTRVKQGDRVAVGADVPCGECRWCRAGLGNNCAINHAIGFQIPGAMAQYMKLPKLVLKEGPVSPISERLDFDTAALAEPLACAINGLELVAMSPGKTVAIIGLGAIGCMMIDLVRVIGAAKVLCVGRSPKRTQIAMQYGADAYINTAEEDVVGRCREETDGHGPDIVMTTCASVEAHEQAVEMVAHRGMVNLFGGLSKDTRPMSLRSNTIHYKECFVTGSHGCVPRHHKKAVALLESGDVRTEPIITHRFPLDDIREAFDTTESRRGMKVIVHPHW